jgi:prepilin-type N-terminal cleavage/methylation domain-containing protein
MKFHRAHKLLARRNQRCQGMSLVEVLVSMLILTVAMIGLLSTLTFAMSATHSTNLDLIAKQLADEAMENIFTARNSDQLQWLQIRNQGATNLPDGIFMNGFLPINQTPTTGATPGLVNTVDYAAAPPRILKTPGVDGTIGTTDDTNVPLTNFTRSIAIATVDPNDQLRSVTVTVQYTVPPLNVVKNYTLQGFISQFR